MKKATIAKYALAAIGLCSVAYGGKLCKDNYGPASHDFHALINPGSAVLNPVTQQGVDQRKIQFWAEAANTMAGAFISIGGIFELAVVAGYRPGTRPSCSLNRNVI